MIVKSLLAGAAAACLFGAVAVAQTSSPPAPAPTQPSDQATQPLNSTTPAGTPYSDSGSGLPPDPSDMPAMSAGKHGSDTAAHTMDRSEAAQIDRCKAMTSDQMMKDKTCAALAKKHPTMMNGEAAEPH
jgi:hypothetical protein